MLEQYISYFEDAEKILYGDGMKSDFSDISLNFHIEQIEKKIKSYPFYKKATQEILNHFPKGTDTYKKWLDATKKADEFFIKNKGDTSISNIAEAIENFRFFALCYMHRQKGLRF